MEEERLHAVSATRFAVFRAKVLDRPSMARPWPV